MGAAYKYVVATGAIIGRRTWADGAAPAALPPGQAYYPTDLVIDPQNFEIKGATPKLVIKVNLLSEADCLAMIDTRAGLLRQAQITTVPGQADVYRRKQDEVDKMSTLGGTLAAIGTALGLMTAAKRASEYPLLTIEMQVMGYTNLTQAYSLVSDAITACNARLNAIEKARRQAKRSVRAAVTLEAKNIAARAAAWPA